jgi:tetratricopeptide (TPR) repeat protein
MDAVREGTAVSTAVDCRSDIYSLGLLLYEALGGNERSVEALSAEARRWPLEARNPQISPGLSDIVEKCLARAPGDRYLTASALAQDLRRHLNDLPLRGVANRSLSERWRKWRRRSPAALGRALVWVAALASVATIVWVKSAQSRQRTLQIETALSDGRAHLRNHRYSDAAHALQRGLDLAAPLADGDEHKRALKAELQQVLREQTAAELRGLVDVLRFRYGLSPPADEEAEVLFRRGQQIWERRARLWQPGEGGPYRDQETREKVRTDLLDLAALLADLRLHWRSAAGGRNEARRAAAQILHDAKQQFGPSPAVSRELSIYEGRQSRTVGEAAQIDATPVRTAWEHYDLGRSYLRSGEHARAAAEFQQSVELHPGEFWPRFFQGICAYRLGRYQEALTALEVCVALMPETAECYYDRGKVYEALEQPEQAMNDYTHALARNPAFFDAALNRGILAFRAGRHDAALNDFACAYAAATGPAKRGLVDYNQALVQIARNDWPAVRASLKQAIASGNGPARELATRLRLD